MNTAFKELDIVELLKPAINWTNPLEKIPAGARGTILEVYTKPREGYDVEFLREDGSHLGMATVTPDRIRLIPRDTERHTR
jgi:hypothetical protein